MRHHYAILHQDGETIENVAIVDDEDEGFSDMRGSFVPFTCADVEEMGWIRVGAEGDEPVAWIGHKVTTERDGSRRFTPAEVDD